MPHAKVFVVSNDPAVRDSIAELAESAGLQAETFSSLRQFLDAAGPGTHGCLVLDAQIGELRDPERQTAFSAACAVMPVVLITDRGDVSTAVRAMKAGATDVVQKPLADRMMLDGIKGAVAADAARHG